MGMRAVVGVMIGVVIALIVVATGVGITFYVALQECRSSPSAKCPQIMCGGGDAQTLNCGSENSFCYGQVDVAGDTIYNWQE